MAKGTNEKQQLFDLFKILFPSMFTDGTSYRIPIETSEGELQFKISLTCAKENVPHDSDTTTVGGPSPADIIAEKIPMSDEEKQKITDFLTRLGLYKA